MYIYTHHTHLYTHKHDTHTVPSGHILTKLELQILGSLLVTYDDEKLKEIQLSIKEKKAKTFNTYHMRRLKGHSDKVG